MVEILTTACAKIRAMKSSFLSLVETERTDAANTTTIQDTATALTNFYWDLFYFSDKFIDEHPGGEEQESLYSDLAPKIEGAYVDWKDIRDTLKETLQMAYDGTIPEGNLVLDSILSELERNIGEPLGELYTKLQTMWNTHLQSHPWNTFLGDPGQHVDSEQLLNSLKDLNHGDELDLEDAVETLTGPLRHIFASYLQSGKTNDSEITKLANRLWNRPEIIIANDYWQQKNNRKMLDILCNQAKSPIQGSFAQVRDLFTMTPTTGPLEADDKLFSKVNSADKAEKEKYFRCLIYHPNQGIRRYAAMNIGHESMWKTITPGGLPCASVLSLLEKIVGMNSDDNFRKIFFNTIHKRMFNLVSRSEVLYARGIVRILTRLDFFLEDDYFEKLTTLMNYIELKEKYYQINDSFLDEHISRIKEAKERSGSVDSLPPKFNDIPPVVLRKLARCGHFWYDLASHPVFKIAKETIPHINSAERALRVASARIVNQDVLRALGKSRTLFSTRTNKMALLSNPRTPFSISLEYVPELSNSDIEELLRKSTLHPELRSHIQKIRQVR